MIAVFFLTYFAGIWTACLFSSSSTNGQFYQFICFSLIVAVLFSVLRILWFAGSALKAKSERIELG